MPHPARHARITALRTALCTAVCTALLATAAPAVLAAQAPAPPTPLTDVTAAALRAHRWIEGDWRGTGADGTVQAPFFERYHFADDSTLLVVSFADSTWRTPTDTSRYELRGGRFGNSGTVRWEAAAIDSVRLLFVPVARARNSFTWERAAGASEPVREWRAVIESAAVRRVYRMERVR